MVVYQKYLFMVVLFMCQLSAFGKHDVKPGHNSIQNYSKPAKKAHAESDVLFVDELKHMLEKYLFGICQPAAHKMPLNGKRRNVMPPCDLDTKHYELATRLGLLSSRAAATRKENPRLGAGLAHAFSELAREAAQRQKAQSHITSMEIKKRKLSKSQKAKIQTKQKLAAKKKPQNHNN